MMLLYAADKTLRGKRVYLPIRAYNLLLESTLHVLRLMAVISRPCLAPYLMEFAELPFKSSSGTIKPGIPPDAYVISSHY